jgi:hypothetical protein
LELWLKHVEKIKPLYVMIYPIDRATPAEDLEKISREELDSIAARVENIGIECRVYE